MALSDATTYLADPVRVTRAQSQAIEGVEQASKRSMYGGAPPEVARALGIAHRRIAGADCLAVARSSHGYLNRVVGLGVRRAASERSIDRIIQWYRDMGSPRATIEVTPLARPAELGVRLLARGFVATGGTAKMWRAAGPVTRTAGDLPVRRVPPQAAKDWFAVMGSVFRHYRNRGEWFNARFRQPGWTFFGAYDDERIVAIGSVFVAAGAAHLVDGATLTAYRRRGTQRRIIEARVRQGLRQGATIFTSETAPPLPRTPLVSHRNLRRVGFEVAYIRAGYRLELN